jgi:hypothetical protein
MNQFGLIIQETTAGSNQQFVSAHLDINSPEIKATITDERTLAAQLGNLSDVYSVQATKNFKVYSLIVTNFTDFLGRSGYYAIRLYGPKGVNLTNFEHILAIVKEKYNNYSRSNSLNNQNYEDILSSILITQTERKNIVSLKNATNFFYYFDEANSTLSTVFNSNGVHLVHKIYAFNKHKAVNESIAVSSGLKSFAQINETLKEIHVVNNQGVLNELKINSQLLDFNPNLSEFNIVCQYNDVVVYNAKDDKTNKIITNHFISIDKKFVPPPKPPKPPYSGSNQRNKNKLNLILGLIALIMGGGTFYYINQNEKIPTPSPLDITGSGTSTEEDTIQNNSKITFEIIEDPSTGKIKYHTDHIKLKQYYFSLDSNHKWWYVNTKGKNKLNPFFKETIDDFNPKLKPDEKAELIQELEDVAGSVRITYYKSNEKEGGSEPNIENKNTDKNNPAPENKKRNQSENKNNQNNNNLNSSKRNIQKDRKTTKGKVNSNKKDNLSKEKEGVKKKI